MQQLALGSVEVPPAGFHLQCPLIAHQDVRVCRIFWITPCVFLDNAFHFLEDVPVTRLCFRIASAHLERSLIDLSHESRSGQRVIVKYALDTDQSSEMAESLLNALEGSLRTLEKHRELILSQLRTGGRDLPQRGC
jgi:hypothetical protein